MTTTIETSPPAAAPKRPKHAAKYARVMLKQLLDRNDAPRPGDEAKWRKVMETLGLTIADIQREVERRDEREKQAAESLKKLL